MVVMPEAIQEFFTTATPAAWVEEASRRLETLLTRVREAERDLEQRLRALETTQ